MRLAIAAIITASIIGTVYARDLDGRYAQSPLRPWFNSLKSRSGTPCCDVTDGQRVEDADWDIKDNHYRVRIEGQWIDVEPEAVVITPNLAGRAIVWPYKDSVDGKIKIRCFLGAELY